MMNQQYSFPGRSTQNPGGYERSPFRSRTARGMYPDPVGRAGCGCGAAGRLPTNRDMRMLGRCRSEQPESPCKQPEVDRPGCGCNNGQMPTQPSCGSGKKPSTIRPGCGCGGHEVSAGKGGCGCDGHSGKGGCKCGVHSMQSGKQHDRYGYGCGCGHTDTGDHDHTACGCSGHGTQNPSLSDSEIRKLMDQIRAVDFALYEVVLYLDVYPHSCDALETYHKLKEQRRHLHHAYESAVGPMTAFGNESTTSWDWMKKPFPWECDAE